MWRRAVAKAAVGLTALSVPTAAYCEQLRLPERYKLRKTCDKTAEVLRIPGPAARPGEPLFTRAEVAKHADPDGPGMWVTYRDGVYDVSEFCHVHPGGKFIFQAAGGPVDNLWAYWHWHHASKDVPMYLEQFRIGRLSDYEGDAVAGVDLYENDPPRPSSQRPLIDRPWSSQVAFSTLDENYLTPANAVYCRSHCPIPDLDNDGYEISFVRGSVDEDAFAEISLEELEKKFGRASVTSVLQCGGNRAAENLVINGPSGFTGTNYTKIDGGMMSNVLWGGIRLAPMVEQMYPEEVRRPMLLALCVSSLSQVYSYQLCSMCFTCLLALPHQVGRPHDPLI